MFHLLTTVELRQLLAHDCISIDSTPFVTDAMLQLAGIDKNAINYSHFNYDEQGVYFVFDALTNYQSEKFLNLLINQYHVPSILHAWDTSEENKMNEKHYFEITHKEFKNKLLPILIRYYRDLKINHPELISYYQAVTMNHKMAVTTSPIDKILQKVARYPNQKLWQKLRLTLFYPEADKDLEKSIETKRTRRYVF